MHLVMMAYIYAACAINVTIFNTSGKFCLVSNFTELLAPPFFCALDLVCCC